MKTPLYFGSPEHDLAALFKFFWRKRRADQRLPRVELPFVIGPGFC
jgi:hypothetical protein